MSATGLVRTTSAARVSISAPEYRLRMRGFGPTMRL